MLRKRKPELFAFHSPPKQRMSLRTKCAAVFIGLMAPVLAFAGITVVSGISSAWASVTLTGNVTCDNYQTVAHVTATNQESEAAHVVAQTGGAWAVGDNIPKPSQTKNVVITGSTAFQVTVNYPSDSTHRPSNIVTLNKIQGCHVTTTTTEQTTTTTAPTTTTSESTTTTRPETTTTTAPSTTTTNPCDHKTPEETLPPGCLPTTTVPQTSTTLLPPTSTVCTAADVGSACATATQPAPSPTPAPAPVAAQPKFTG